MHLCVDEVSSSNSPSEHAASEATFSVTSYILHKFETTFRGESGCLAQAATRLFTGVRSELPTTRTGATGVRVIPLQKPPELTNNPNRRNWCQVAFNSSFCSFAQVRAAV